MIREGIALTQKTQKIFGYFGFFGNRGGGRFGPKIFQKIAFFGPMCQKFLVQNVIFHSITYIFFIFYWGVNREKKNKNICYTMFFALFWHNGLKFVPKKIFLVIFGYRGGLIFPDDFWAIFEKSFFKKLAIFRSVCQITGVEITYYNILTGVDGL